MAHLNKSLLRFTVVIAWFIIFVACQTTQPTQQVAQNDDIQDIRVRLAEPIKTTTKVEQFPLPNCGGTDKLEQSLGTYASASKSATVGATARVNGGAEAGISPVVKLKLEIQVELAYQQTFESANSRLDQIKMSAASGTHVVYTIVWEEQTFDSIVQYSNDNIVYEVPYSYKLSVPKIDKSYNPICPTPSGGSTTTSSPAVARTVIAQVPTPRQPSSGSCIATPHTGLGQADHFFSGTVHIAELWRANRQTPWEDKLVTAVVHGDLSIVGAGGSVWTFPVGCEDRANREVYEGASRTGAIVVTEDDLRNAGMIR